MTKAIRPEQMDAMQSRLQAEESRCHDWLSVLGEREDANGNLPESYNLVDEALHAIADAQEAILRARDAMMAENVAAKGGAR